MSESPSLWDDLGSVVRLVGLLLGLAYQIITSIIHFATFIAPRILYSIIHWSFNFTLQLNFVKVFTLFLLGTSVISYFWKVRYLNRYSSLKAQPIVKNEGFDLHPDMAKNPLPPGFHNYLDEFLSAIKVFGYLEKPVFHELARHLQTRRLVAGDTLNLSSDNSFYIVIDGTVQVFSQTSTSKDGCNHHSEKTAFDDEDDNGFRLLNQVESGGTLSSLFTILSLFTEDLELVYEEETPIKNPTRIDDFAQDHEKQFQRPLYTRRKSMDVEATPTSTKRHTTRFNVENSTSAGADTDVSDNTTESGESAATERQGDYDHDYDHNHVFGSSKPSLGLQAIESGASTPLSARSHSDYWGSSHSYRKRSGYNTGDSSGATTIARATVDTTLAVIPAEAFRRLTTKFPNAAAHIVQVILTRLQRVTFLTAHKYLGLTREVLRTEKAFNELARYPLPKEFFESGGVDKLRHRFIPESKLPTNISSDPESEEEPFFNRRNELFTSSNAASFDPPPSSNFSSEKGAQGIRLRPAKFTRQGSSKKTGDLLTMSTFSSMPANSLGIDFMPLSPGGTSRDSSIGFGYAEEFDLRGAVMECISKAIGLIQPMQPASPVGTGTASPSSRPHDNKSPFNSSFGNLSLLGLQQADDESSVTGSASTNTHHHAELENEVEILYFPKGTTLIKEGDANSGLYYVIDGFLEVSITEQDSSDSNIKNFVRTSRAQTPRTQPVDLPKNDSSAPKTTLTPLYTVKQGGIAGYLSSLSGFSSYVDVSAKTDCYVGYLSEKAMERILDRRPIVLFTLVKRLISLLSPLILHLDAALEWMQAESGQVIYREGDEADSLYIVLNGRLRSINETVEGGITVLHEYGQGDSVGELDCITASPRQSTLHAIRDTELARMPMTLFNSLSVHNPAVSLQITRIIASRVRKQLDRKTQSKSQEMGRNNYNLKTVAILPVSRQVPIIDFATKLFHALESMGSPTSYLNQTSIISVLGRHAFSKMGTLKLAGWLAETEQKYRIVLYVADTTVSSPWTQTCIRQADCIFLIGDAGTSPELGDYEKLLMGMKTTARKELVLLHPERVVPPGSTRKWLTMRPWVHAHHHIEMEGATLPAPMELDTEPVPVMAFRRLAKKVETEYVKYQQRNRPASNPVRLAESDDFARLARRLCGKSVGVVLGGGGARGIAHIGVLQEITSHGIPIDMIGGTSIGAFVGGLYAKEGELVSTFGRAKRFSGRMSTLWRLLTDVTYPVVSYTTGHEFNRGIYKSFYDLHIEDMWLPFYCNTTNITHSRMEVHKTGYAWRYVRASMSLAGVLPPLSDNGNMLVDGGYVDNLPVSDMFSMGAASVFAVDVGSVDDTSPRDYPESVSGWSVLLSRWNPFSTAPNIPSMTEIQARLTYVSSVKTLEEAKVTPGVLYMRMPVTQFGTMEFKKFNEILKVGSEAAREMISQFQVDDKIPEWTFRPISQTKKPKRGQSARRNSI